MANRYRDVDTREYPYDNTARQDRTHDGHRPYEPDLKSRNHQSLREDDYQDYSVERSPYIVHRDESDQRTRIPSPGPHRRRSSASPTARTTYNGPTTTNPMLEELGDFPDDFANSIQQPPDEIVDIEFDILVDRKGWGKLSQASQSMLRLYSPNTKWKMIYENLLSTQKSSSTALRQRMVPYDDGPRRIQDHTMPHPSELRDPYTADSRRSSSRKPRGHTIPEAEYHNASGDHFMRPPNINHPMSYNTYRETTSLPAVNFIGDLPHQPASKPRSRRSHPSSRWRDNSEREEDVRISNLVDQQDRETHVVRSYAGDRLEALQSKYLTLRHELALSNDRIESLEAAVYALEKRPRKQSLPVLSENKTRSSHAQKKSKSHVRFKSHQEESEAMRASQESQTDRRKPFEGYVEHDENQDKDKDSLLSRSSETEYNTLSDDDLHRAKKKHSRVGTGSKNDKGTEATAIVTASFTGIGPARYFANMLIAQDEPFEYRANKIDLLRVLTEEEVQQLMDKIISTRFERDSLDTLDPSYGPLRGKDRGSSRSKTKSRRKAADLSEVAVETEQNDDDKSRQADDTEPATMPVSSGSKSDFPDVPGDDDSNEPSDTKETSLDVVLELREDNSPTRAGPIENYVESFIMSDRKDDLAIASEKIRDSLPESCGRDLEYSTVYGEKERHGAWTCTLTDPDKTLNYPLKIAGASVVIPIQAQMLSMEGHAVPQDPREMQPIDCRAEIPLDAIRDIFLTFQGIIGFYVLVNGFLQLIVPEPFESNMKEAWSKYPHWFGGLKVSYIPFTISPTMAPTGPTSRVRSASTQGSTASKRSRFSHGSQSSIHSTTRPLQLNDVVEARSNSSGSRTQGSSGRIGLQVIKDKVPYLLVSTHVITTAMMATGRVSAMLRRKLDRPSKLPNDWMARVEVWAGNRKFGSLEHTFDPEAGVYPNGFKHDITVIKPYDSSSVEKIVSPIPDLGWLSHKSWSSLCQRTSPIYILGSTGQDRSAKTLETSLPSNVEIVGKGIFRNRSENHDVKNDKKINLEAWKDMVSISVLYRTNPGFDPPHGCSGIALQTDGIREDGTHGPGIVGFQSFVQHSEVAQVYNGDGAALSNGLEKGVIAFYGAFEVPEELRKNYTIV